MLDFSNDSTKPKYYNSNKLVLGKMKDQTAGVAIEEFVRSKRKMYSYLIDDNSDHKKAKGVNRNIVATISHSGYKNFLQNGKWLRHLMNINESKDHKIGTYKINKAFLSCFEYKIYIQNSGCDGLALGYQS